jgi:hypothetical protein
MYSVKLFTIRELLLYNQQRNRCLPTETSRRTEAARCLRLRASKAQTPPSDPGRKTMNSNPNATENNNSSSRGRFFRQPASDNALDRSRGCAASRSRLPSIECATFQTASPAGSFTPSAEARSLSKAFLFAGGSLPSLLPVRWQATSPGCCARHLGRQNDLGFCSQ